MATMRPITYGRLGKKRALLQATARSGSGAESTDDPIDLLPPSPTRSPVRKRLSKLASAGSPVKANESPKKVPRPAPPASPRRTRSLDKPVTNAPPAESTIPLDITTPSTASLGKRKRIESLAVPVRQTRTTTQSSKRSKATRTILQDDDEPSVHAQQPESPSTPLPIIRNLRPGNGVVSISDGPRASGSKDKKSEERSGISERPLTPTPPSTPPPDTRPSLGLPKKIPRDLSGLFDDQSPGTSQEKLGRPSSPSRTSASTAGTPRRSKMLSRSATLPDAAALAFSSQSASGGRTPTRTSPKRTASYIQKTASLPSFPSPSKSDRSPSPQRDPPADPSTSVEPLPLRPSVRTYSSSRSFLVPLPTPLNGSGEDASHLQDEFESQEMLQHESYSDLRKKYRVDLSSDDDMETGIAGPVDLKSIGELRDKGENRRFMDDMGYILEGLDPQMSIAVRRLSAVKLVDNMADIDYVRRAKACDALGSAWNALEGANRGAGDKILGLALVSFAALATRDPRHADELAAQSSVMRTLSEHVNLFPSNDPFGFDTSSTRIDDARRLGIGKTERTMISQIRGILTKADMLPEGTYFTSRRLASQSLMALRAHDTSIIPPLLESFLLEADTLLSRLKAHAIGLSIHPDEPTYDTPDLQHVDNCLHVLEATLITSATNSLLSSQRVHVAQALIAIITVCAAVDHEPARDDSTASNCLISALRVLVKLADASPEWSVELAKVPLAVSLLLRITSSYRTDRQNKGHDILAEDADANRLDIMCLSLALLTSLVLDAKAARTLVFQSKLAPVCSFGRSCIKGCQCRGSSNAVSVLIGLYTDEGAKSQGSTNAEASFLTGHLAILLGLLCDGASNKDVESLLRQMPGGPSSRDKLNAWVDAIREFVGLYSDLAQRFAQAIESSRAERDGGDMSARYEDNEDEDDDEDLGSNSPRRRIAGPSAFEPDESKGSQKGVELAEKVIRLLTSLADTLPDMS